MFFVQGYFPNLISFLFPHNLDNEIPIPAPVIKIDEYDLLPCPQSKFSLDDGDGEARFHQGSPHMREPIAIPPASVMVIGNVRWYDLFNGLL